MSDAAIADRVSSRRDLGSISAEEDNRFSQHFVTAPDFSCLLSDECMIVAGAKGSGKTAVMRALADIGVYAERYSAVLQIKLDGLRFAPLFAAIKKLDEASNHGVVAIARSSWQNAIAIFLLEALLDTRLLDSPDRTEIRKYLHSTGHLRTKPNDKLLGHLERTWRVIAKMSKDEASDDTQPLLGLNARQQEAIASFPADQKLDALLTHVLAPLRASGRPALLCLDGLDSVIECSVDSRDYVFAGLIDAVFKCATHPKLKGCLVIKALIPKELAHGARRHLRDLDKIEPYVESIHWNADNLGLFIKRRLEEHTRTKNRQFDEVWREFFPERVRNAAHGIEEDTYQYLLRHTLYRPRQLLLHVQRILNAWDTRATHAPFRVDPTFIPKIVADTNISLAEYVVNELGLDFPNLASLLKSFKNLPNVMPWLDMSARLQRYLQIPPERVDESFTELYNYGLFGVCSPTEGRPSHVNLSHFSFGFMTKQVERNVVGGMDDRSLVALAPMFTEFCGSRPSPTGVVCPAP